MLRSLAVWAGISLAAETALNTPAGMMAELWCKPFVSSDRRRMGHGLRRFSCTSSAEMSRGR